MTLETFLTLEEFWALPEGETAYELINGQALTKVSPKFFHSTLQAALNRLIYAWGNEKWGRILPEWAVTLKRNGQDWVPTPDLTYVSYERLPKSWKRNEACPVPCDLAIEIISPGQTFKEFDQKAQAYVSAGVQRVWVIEPEIVNIVAFFLDGTRQIYADNTEIIDPLLPGLCLTPNQIFQEAGLI